MVDKEPFVICDATFRCRENFGKDVAAWPADMQVAVRRALHNFREKTPEAGELVGADVDWSHSTSALAISHPWIVQITTVYKRQRPN